MTETIGAEILKWDDGTLHIYDNAVLIFLGIAIIVGIWAGRDIF